jgi:hypothetical protein
MCMWVCRVSNRITRACPLLAGVVLFLASSPAPAQTAGGTTGGGTTGGTGLGNLGGGATGGGGGGAGGGGGSSNLTTAGQSAFGSLGPSTGMGPTVSIGGPANARGAANGVAGTVSIPTTSNPLGSFYYNYLQYGINTSGGGSISNATSLQSTFGQPLFGTATTTTGQAAGAAGAGAATNQGAGFTTLGRSRAPAYYTALSEDFPLPQRSTGKLQNEVQGILQRTLKGQPIQVRVSDDGRVILRGAVATARDRERAELQVRITPGVEDVVNELTFTGIASTTAAPIQRASN